MPEDATKMTLEFRLFNAVNNYYWAIDNIRLLEKASLPEMTLEGDSSLVIDQGSEFIDPGVKAFDQLDGDLTDKVVVEHNVDTSTPGIYEVIYSVTNSTGFTVTETREVMVMGTTANEGLNMSFSVISDLHTNDEKISRALWDLHLINPNQHAMVAVGDIVDAGEPAQYDQVKKTMASNPHPENLFYTIGNHEYYYGIDTDTGMSQFLEFAGLDKVYYEKEVNGYPFIMLGQEEAEEPVQISEAQLQWLEETLKKHDDSNKPIFVFLHQPLPYTIYGTWDIWYYKNSIVQYEKLKEILSKYPQVIYFSGHTHWDLRFPDMFGNHDGFYQVSTGALINTYGPDGKGGEKIIDGTGSTGLYVQVYDDKVVINGRDFTNSKWIDEYSHVISYKAEQVDKAELEIAIADADKLDREVYTDESVQAFNEKLATAKDVYANDDATQEEIDTALTELKTAMETLEEKVESVDKSELESAIADAEEINTESYTDKSVQTFNEKLATAKDVYKNDEATQEKVDTALSELQSAIDALEEKVESVDKSELETTIADAEKIDTEGFTDESVQLFNEKLATAKDVLANNEVSQEEVDTALADLESAIEALEEKPIDKSELASLIETAEDIDTEGYTEESAATFEEKLTYALAVLENEQVTQAEVDEALEGLQSAIEDLQLIGTEADKSDLESAVKKGEEIDTKAYTEDSVNEFVERLNHAYAILEDKDASQADVNDALRKLQASIEALEEVKSVDKYELESAIEDAEKMDKDRYTEESIQVLVQKITEAKEILTNDEATQEQVDIALAELQAAIEALEEVDSVDKSELESSIADAEEVDKDQYTKESIQVLVQKIAEAKDVYANDDATQEEVDTALAELKAALEALDELVEIVDKSELEAVIKESESINLEKYTKESVEFFKEKLAKAKVVFADEDASQAEVDEAIKALQHAIDDLKLIETKKKDKDKKDTNKNNSKNVNTNVNKNKDNDVNKNKVGQVNKNKDNNKSKGITSTNSKNKEVTDSSKKLPKTATSMYNLILLGLILASVGMIAVYISNKRKKIKE